MRPHRYLLLECIALFGIPPLIIMQYKERSLMVALLWLSAFGSYYLLKKFTVFTYKKEWNREGSKAGVSYVLKRFALCAPILIGFVLLHDTDRFLSFPREKPGLWLMVMLLYPVLSVWPQELLYRSFFFARYAHIFKTPLQLRIASAAAFGYAHIIFFNWVAVILTLVGGYFFALTYARYRSLALICFEHALYGCFIFTIGLGWYFYGAAWWH